MEKAMNTEKRGTFVIAAMMGLGGAIGLWALTTLTFALAKVDWQVSELFRQYLVSVGVIKEFDTLVDFYTHIKGVEYIICAAFLGAFPLFFKYLSTTKAPVPSK